MIVRRISIEHFGRFLEPFEIELQPGRPNLLAGPNGSGKSTLLAALTAAFTIPANSTAQEIRRWQPWQRALHPVVKVEFEHAGVPWRLRKEFAFGPRGTATLESYRSGQWLPEAQGRAADEHLATLLGGTQGAAAGWLAPGALWARQNQLSKIDLGAPLQDRIRASLGAQIRSGPLERVLREAKQLYDRDWTATRGAQRQNSELRSQQSGVSVLHDRVRSLRASLEELDKDRAAFEHLDGEAAHLEAEKTRLEERMRALDEDFRRKTVLDAQRLEREKERQEAAHELKSIDAILALRRSIHADLQDAAQKLVALAAELEQARAAVRSGEDALVRARGDVSARLVKSETELAGLNAPPRQTLEEITRLDQQLRELEAKLEGALLHVRLDLEADARVEVRRGRPEGWLAGRTGESLEISGSPEIELGIPSLGRLRIWGPAESAETLQRQIGELRSARLTLVEPWGSGDLPVLAERRRRAEALEQELEGLRRVQLGHESGHSAEAIALSRARDGVAGLETRHREAQETQRQIEERKRQLDSEPRDEAALLAGRQDAALRHARAEASLKELQEQLALLPAHVEQQRAQAESELQSVLRRREQVLESKNLLRGRIEQRQQEGLYALLGEAEAQLAEDEQRLEHARRHAHANRLLWRTLNAVLEEAEQEILPRLGQRTISLLSQISGEFLENVSLDARSWTPVSVHPAVDGGNLDVEVDRISGGEQEQLFLALRLALADLLAEHEPQLVVLDDVLLATDSARLSRILQLLAERSRRMQFLILTCHPERFEALSDACLIRLGDSRAAAQ